MTRFSWTGISRTTGVEKKLPFQNYSGVLDLMYEIIKKADCRWTETMNIKLFKDKILKHSKKIEETYEKNRKKKTDSKDEDCTQSPVNLVVEEFPETDKQDDM